MSYPVSAARPRTGLVFLTLFGLLAIAGLIALPSLSGKPPESGVPDMMRFLGRFHPLILHLPIGMLTLVLIAETGRLFRKDKGPHTGVMGVFFAAVTAVVAVLLGFLLYYSAGGEYKQELAEKHLYTGIAFACAVVGAFIVKIWVNAAAGRGSVIYWIFLLASTGIMSVAGHYGAGLSHGESYLTDYAPDPVRKVLGLQIKAKKDDKEPKEDGGTEPAAGGNGGGEVAAADPVIYADVIAPIFQQKCYSCHGEEKQKGKLRMDDYDLLVKGGKKGDDIVHGKASASLVVVRVELPKDDDDKMPPEGKKEMTPDEVMLLKWWIDSGASKDAKLSTLKPSDEIKAAIAKLAPAAGSSVKEKQVAEEGVKKAADKRETMKTEVDRLRKDFPAALNFESQTSPGLVFTAVSMRKSFGDGELAKLKPLMPEIVSMDLSASTVTDNGAKMLEDAKELRSLRLSETAVTDASLDSLSKLSKLESLNLFGTQVTNEGVSKLASLSGLKKLYLWQTKVDAAGIDELKKKLPGCEIIVGL